MGTINYGTSDYITLGIEPYNYSDFEKDQEFMEEAKKQVKKYGGTIEDCIYNEINTCYECDYMNAEYILNKYPLHYFHVAIKSGYYEGFYIDIESNFSIAYDNYIEKREAQKEITQIKKMLIELAGVGYGEVYSGWVSSYMDYKTTLKSINRAIKEMRSEAASIPTWRQYERSIA